MYSLDGDRIFIKISNSPIIKIISQNLEEDGSGSLDGESYILPHEDVYRIEPEQRTLLGLPNEFGGLLTISPTGLINSPNTRFNYQFSDKDGNDVFNPRPYGSILEITANERYLLSSEHYQLLRQINSVNKCGDNTYERWNLIELVRTSGERVRFDGLPNDIVVAVNSAGVDIVPQQDGSLELFPRLGTLSSQKIEQYKRYITDENRNGLVATESAEGKIYRYNLHSKALESARRIYRKNTISKEDAEKFFENPRAFLAEGEECNEDFGLNLSNYRIKGIGEPYIGYFGSVGFGLGDIFPKVELEAAEIRKKIKTTIAGFSFEEVGAALNDLKIAEEQGNSTAKCGERVIHRPEFPTVIDELEKLIKRAKPPLKPKEASDTPKLVLRILPNDTEGVGFELVVQNPLETICTQLNEPLAYFDNLTASPKPHQISGTRWLVDMYKNGYRGALLADDMGLGKTYQTIAFLDDLLHKGDARRVLIVTPAILVENWRKEINTFVKKDSRWNVEIVRGNGLRHRLDKKVKSYNTFDVQELLHLKNNPTVIITTYETLANYQIPFAQNDHWRFSCVVYDEAHKIKNPNAQISQSARAISGGIPFSLLLTGTPIENELRDLWTLFDVFAPTHFGTWEEFKKEFVGQKQINVDDRLRDRCSNYLLRRLKSDHLKDLPTKEVKTYDVQFASEDEIFYEKIMNAPELALQRLQRIKKFGIHKSLSYAVSDDLEQLFSEGILTDFAKTKELISLLEQIRGKEEKVIIFLTSRIAQDLLRYHLQMHFGIKIPVINGDNNRNVDHYLNAFKSHEGFNIIILSSLTAGVGLTITEANHVIHYERWWNASKEDQASDRVYRIGATKPVFIHHIIGTLSSGKTSFDQAVNKLINQKRSMAGFLIPPNAFKDADISEGIGIPMTLEEQVAALEWFEFEVLVKRIYEAMEYECELTPEYPEREYGADIVARKEGEVVAIQCKHSGNGKIKNKEAMAQLVMEAKKYYKATSLVAVTNTKFDQIARQLADEHDVQVMEKEDLCGLISIHKISI